jgi:hypothetical protein
MQVILHLAKPEYNWVKALMKVAQNNSDIKHHLFKRNYGRYPSASLNLGNLLEKDGHSGGTMVWTCDVVSFWLKLGQDSVVIKCADEETKAIEYNLTPFLADLQKNFQSRAHFE